MRPHFKEVYEDLKTNYSTSWQPIPGNVSYTKTQLASYPPYMKSNQMFLDQPNISYGSNQQFPMNVLEVSFTHKFNNYD